MHFMKKRKRIRYLFEEVDEKYKTNKRKIQRKITAIKEIHLLITIISGTIYSILPQLGVDSFWVNQMACWGFWHY